MAIRHFFTERTKLRPHSSVKLADTEADHIRKSLKMKSGDEIILFNGENKFKAKLTLISSEAVMAEIIDKIDVQETTRPQVTLLQGIIRLPNFELALQKCTELGVDNFVPLETEFSQVQMERLDAKTARWQKIIVEACKQSERTTIPQLYAPITFEEISGLISEFDLVLFCTVPRLVTSKMATITPISQLIVQIQTAKHVALLIGPEGGFSPTEHKLALEWKLPFVSLGEGVLKAETAAIAASALVRLLS